jgi:hypothetical protein
MVLFAQNIYIIKETGYITKGLQLCYPDQLVLSMTGQHPNGSFVTHHNTLYFSMFLLPFAYEHLLCQQYILKMKTCLSLSQ